MTGRSSGSRDTHPAARVQTGRAPLREQLFACEIEEADTRSVDFESSARRLGEQLRASSRALLADAVSDE